MKVVEFIPKEHKPKQVFADLNQGDAFRSLIGYVYIKMAYDTMSAHPGRALDVASGSVVTFRNSDEIESLPHAVFVKGN